MGIRAALEDETSDVIDGTVIIDPTNILHRLLPPADDPGYVHVSAIDWYGNSTFNHLQMPRFLTEWREVERRAQASDEPELVGEIRRLAEQVANERHIYLVPRRLSQPYWSW